jgi:hypothetical protein
MKEETVELRDKREQTHARDLNNGKIKEELKKEANLTFRCFGIRYDAVQFDALDAASSFETSAILCRTNNAVYKRTRILLFSALQTPCP